jgi:hypothetical protein
MSDRSELTFENGVAQASVLYSIRCSDRARGATRPATELPTVDVTPLVGDFHDKIGTFRTNWRER